jgi:hypothetical protein
VIETHPRLVPGGARRARRADAVSQRGLYRRARSYPGERYPRLFEHDHIRAGQLRHLPPGCRTRHGRRRVRV